VAQNPEIGDGSAFAPAPSGYLDALGGSPLLPAAVTARRAAEEIAWADPARLHHAGRTAGLVLDSARASIASFLGVRPSEVHLTSSVRAALEFGLAGLLATRPAGAIALSSVESLTLFEAADRSVYLVHKTLNFKNSIKYLFLEPFNSSIFLLYIKYECKKVPES